MKKNLLFLASLFCAAPLFAGRSDESDVDDLADDLVALTLKEQRGQEPSQANQLPVLERQYSEIILPQPNTPLPSLVQLCYGPAAEFLLIRHRKNPEATLFLIAQTFSPKGSEAGLCSLKQEICTFLVREHLARLPLAKVHELPATPDEFYKHAIAFSEDEKYIILKHNDAPRAIWDIATEKQCDELAPYTPFIFTKNHLSAAGNKCIRMIPESYRTERDAISRYSISYPKSCCMSVCCKKTDAALDLIRYENQTPQTSFSPNERYLASKVLGEPVILWDTTTGACIKMLPTCQDAAHQDGLEDLVVFSPQGTYLATCPANASKIEIWSYTGTLEEALAILAPAPQ
jgi:hypothetical protein